MRRTIIGYGALAFLAVLGLSGAVTDGGEGRRVSYNKGSSAGENSLLNENGGISAKYPGDKGIEEDQAVVFHETFEEGTVRNLDERWTNISNEKSKVLDLVMESPPGSLGKRCLRMTATKGQNTGGHLWKLLEPGYDKLYARFYVKFSPDHPYVHHFVHMGAQWNSPPYPLGGAGSRPNGAISFSTGIDLGNREKSDPPGAWFLYTYWCEMRSYETPEGEGSKFYGNPFAPPEPEQAPRDKWQCIEFMIKCNSAPDKHDGEQAYWVDGRLIGRFAPGTPEGTWLRDTFHTSGPYNTNPQPFEGFRWRTTNELKINTFWLLYYLASIFEQDIKPENPDIPYNSEMGQVLFDDIVLATEYIGPIVTELPDSGETGCDFNGDGRATAADVIQLLLMNHKDPLDRRADYNNDGRCNIIDAIALLIDIMAGKC
ncbi:MAG TPA: dockerin type I repeat-containing protein [archaeon]|nr:dockerin type I repeat-containing protein [archaeon]